MILYIIKWTLIYSILILLLHNLYLFFQNNLTTTKIKDYYNTFAIENAKINKNNLDNIENNNKINENLFNNIKINSTEINDLNELNTNSFNNNQFNIDQFNKDFFNEFNSNNIINDNNMKSELNDFLSKLNYN